MMFVKTDIEWDKASEDPIGCKSGVAMSISFSAIVPFLLSKYAEQFVD